MVPALKKLSMMHYQQCQIINIVTVLHSEHRFTHRLSITSMMSIAINDIWKSNGAGSQKAKIDGSGWFPMLSAKLQTLPWRRCRCVLPSTNALPYSCVQ